MEAIHIIGAGGIGCAVGHTLLANRHPVVFVESCPDKLAWGRKHGVAIAGRPALRAEFVPFAEWSPPASALVLLCTKCPANTAVLARLPASARLVPIQNGVDTALDGRGPRVEGIASFVSESPKGETHTRITRRGGLHLGINGSSTDDLRGLRDQLVGWLQGGPFRVHRVEDIQPYKYTKLLYNSAISPLAAAAGLDNGELLRWPRLRGLFFAMLRENHAILRQAGVRLERIGPFHPATVARILARPWLANLLAWVFYPSLRGTYCSMAPDLLHTRATEIDNYNGHLIHLAGNFPCPLNRAVCDLVRKMERECLSPHPDRLADIWQIEVRKEPTSVPASPTQVAG